MLNVLLALSLCLGAFDEENDTGTDYGFYMYACAYCTVYSTLVGTFKSVVLYYKYCILGA